MPSFKEKLSEEKKEPKSPFCLRACCGKFQGPLQIGRWRAQRHLSGDRAGTIYRGVPRSSDFYRGMGSQWFEGGGEGGKGGRLGGEGTSGRCPVTIPRGPTMPPGGVVSGSIRGPSPVQECRCQNVVLPVSGSVVALFRFIVETCPDFPIDARALPKCINRCCVRRWLRILVCPSPFPPLRPGFRYHSSPASTFPCCYPACVAPQ